jgi:hypothetical protein
MITGMITGTSTIHPEAVAACGGLKGTVVPRGAVTAVAAVAGVANEAAGEVGDVCAEAIFAKPSSRPSKTARPTATRSCVDSKK